VTISSILGAGYAIYKPPQLSNVDCLAMRRIDHHARHLRRVLDSVSIASVDLGIDDSVVSREWRRVHQWLEMAAGLRFVDIERLEDDASLWMCSSASRYNDAHNNIASDYATEQMRLHYVWSAVERLLKIIELPEIPRKRSTSKYSRAGVLLTERVSSGDLPEHYSCTLKHLRNHMREERELASDPAATEAVTKRAWRSESAMLLAAGNALRHIPAHGDTEVPEPDDWDENIEGAGRTLPVVLHAPRLGARGLLLSLQMLVSLTTDGKVHNSWNMPELGWWVRAADSAWTRTCAPTARELLAIAHLQPPRDDDEREDDDLDEGS
jgi:hypothetical protein